MKKSIDEQGKLTDELAAAIDSAKTLAEVEDLYRPYKQKRRTRATMAKEKGLEPLAALLFAQERDCPRPEEAARDFVDPEKGVETVEEALQGASDIIAEWISDDAAVRGSLREMQEKRGTLRSLAATEEDSVYRLYYDFEQPLSRLQGHQILAINRGEKEKMLSATVLLERELALPLLRRAVVKPGSAAMEFVKSAAEDAYDRLIYPSLEREMRALLTERADEGAIGQFALNLKPLLMQPPVKGKVTMGLDPGYRMGCKVAVVDGTGKVLDTAVVYPTHGERQKSEAIAVLSRLIRKHGVEHIAIGNGTASRETEQMAVELIRRVNGSGANVSYMIVSEAGASVYSASKLAAEEFPQYDVNLRSAVSIARRLQDPLAELAKIDPKAIGVGQYQHDMPQKRLDEALSGVMEDCVNAVGVDINTASSSLLQRVSGLNATTAKNVVAYREENGAFTSRAQIKNVVDLESDANQDNRLFNFLLFLFPYYLKTAMRKGLFKKYIRYRYNNGNVKGMIDIARHIEKNTPFLGNVAYSQREFSYDNCLMELVRHTIEFIKRKPYGKKLLIKVKDEVKLVIDATSEYEPCDRQKIIEQNKKNTVRHAYFREYLALQRLCLLILQHQKHQIGAGARQIYGILFDGAWLWEEYVNSLIEDVFYHPMNKGGKGAQRLFDGNVGLIYPDFISRNSETRIIADAKYKPVDNIGNRDYLQVLAYMFRFDAKAGYYLYPEAAGTDDKKLWMNCGSTYEKNVMPRDDISLTKHGLKIPVDALNYAEFSVRMKTCEQEFKSALIF